MDKEQVFDSNEPDNDIAVAWPWSFKGDQNSQVLSKFGERFMMVSGKIDVDFEYQLTLNSSVLCIATQSCDLEARFLELD